MQSPEPAGSARVTDGCQPAVGKLCNLCSSACSSRPGPAQRPPLLSVPSDVTLLLCPPPLVKDDTR